MKSKTERAKVILFFALSVCLAKSAFAQTLESLTEQIVHGNTEQKRSALFQIRNIRAEEFSRIAVSALRDNDEIVRATAAFSVIYLPENEAVQVLLPLLQDKSALVRRETAYALGEVGSSNASNSLLQTLQRDKILEVRNAAIVAFGEIGDPAAVPALTEILQSKPKTGDEFTRRSAAKSIGQIACSVRSSKLKNDSQTNFQAENNKETSTFQKSNLIRNFPVFLNAGKILIQVLQNPKEFEDAKREAAFALGEIGDESAIPVLRANLDNSDYYLAEISKKALQKISPEIPK